MFDQKAVTFTDSFPHSRGCCLGDSIVRAQKISPGAPFALQYWVVGGSMEQGEVPDRRGLPV